MEQLPELKYSEAACRKAREFTSNGDSPHQVLKMCLAAKTFFEGDPEVAILEKAILMDKRVQECRTLQSAKDLATLRDVEVNVYSSYFSCYNASVPYQSVHYSFRMFFDSKLEIDYIANFVLLEISWFDYLTKGPEEIR